MLIAKYVACVYIDQHVRQKMRRESPYILDVSVKFGTQLMFCNFAHLLWAHLMNAKLRKDCIKNCCKWNKQSTYKQNVIIV